MLKLMPTFNFNTQAKTKCGEIFCHNSTDFTVYCTFCEMKSFSFEDFLWHLKTLHFASDLCKNETSSYGPKLETEEDKIYDNLIQSYDDGDADNVDFENPAEDDFGDDDDGDFCDNDSYDEPLAILKKRQMNKRPKRRKTVENKTCKSDNSDEEIIDFESDEEFKPKLSECGHSCHQCGETFKSSGLLKTHINRIHDDKSSESSNKKEKPGKQISCNECDQMFPYKKSLYSHIVEYHMGFKCSMCDKRFKQLQQRDRHEFCHTATRVFSCDVEGCDKSFTHKYYLQRHIDSHNKERKFVCDYENCNKAFHTLRCLKAHKNRHTKPKNLICDSCGYTCREYDRLRIHQRVHTGEKPYGCQECGKRFTSNAALLEHTVSHTGVRSHICSNCNASFTRQKSLYQHRLKCASTSASTCIKLTLKLLNIGTETFSKGAFNNVAENNKKLMLKILPLANLSNQPKAKCGEIFCHSSSDFTIYCTFCDMKAFTFEDFLLHVQNVHFENNILKTETFTNEYNQYFEVNVKVEATTDTLATEQLHEEEVLWDNLEQTYDEADDLGHDNYEEDNVNDSFEEEIMTVLKKTKKQIRAKKEKRVKPKSYIESGDEEDNDHSSDEDFKPLVNDKASSAGDQEEEKPFQCTECSKAFKNLGLLKIHHTRIHEKKSSESLEKKEKEDKEQLCPECEQIFPNKKYLDKHIFEDHGGYKCAHCDKRFKQRHQRKRHEQCHTAERVFTCHFEGCGKGFTEKYYLKRHIDIHTTERNFICDFENCGKAFYTQRRLNVHKKIHTKPKNLVCDACGYICRENRTLRVHLRMHTGEKPYACEVCDKRFISSSALSEHMSSHSNTRPHICKVCNASFAHQKALYHHSFLHSDVKKFRCKICDSAYKQASGLAGHMRKHRQEGMMYMLPKRPTISTDPIPPPNVVGMPPSYPFTSFYTHTRMLKILPLANLSNQPKAKCGEIFCHSSSDFTIYCTFCDMKAFTFEDFLLHVQNVHFENNILKTENFTNECNQYFEVNVKAEATTDNLTGEQLHEEEVLWDNLEQTYDQADDLGHDDYEEDDVNDSFEEETVTVLKKTKKQIRAKKEKRVKPKSYIESGDEEDNDHSSDEDFKPLLNVKVSSTDGTEEEKPFQCTECSKAFKNLGLLKIHHTRIHEEKYSESLEKKEKEDEQQLCPECEKIFPNKKYLDKHVFVDHGGYKCAHCDKRFKQRHKRKRHEQYHTAERVFTCHFEGCGKSFTEKYYLKRHVDIHSTERNLICDFENCGKAFHTQRLLSAHKKIHTKPKNLVCDACGYICRDNLRLRVHLRGHTGEKPYACEVCDKRFISSSALSEHMASHSNTRPHVCKVCNASFARQKALYHHSFLHSDVKKFRCKICDSAYKQASGLAGHMRKHREEGMMSMLPE
ncbi:zinc finger protein 62 homolog [Calliphora vicina]|uniref:zinc finger protein 62 homolog n=1 Tax=Calliphora vicina TaxID=7373 RepID=UPI00325BDC95